MSSLEHTSILLGLLATLALAGCQSANRDGLDSRRLMLAASKEGDQDFPEAGAAELIRYAHLGEVETATGLLYVVEVRWRLTDMPAPRGYTKLSFFTSDFKYIGSQRCGRTHPMICRGPCVLMWGSEFVGDQVGNAWDLSKGFDSRRLIQRDEGFGERESLPSAATR